MSEEIPKPTKKYYDYISVGNRTKQVAYFVQQHDKSKMFLELLKPLTQNAIVVVTKSKRSADALATLLKEKEINALAIHGNHRVSQIEEAGTAFNEKTINILITTDKILELLKLENVSVMMNFDLPLDPAEYFKRLRYVDEIGESISLIDPDDEGTLSLIEIMMKCEMKEEELEGFEHTQKEMVKKDKSKKPRHKKVQQRAKKKADMKAKWGPKVEETTEEEK